MGISKERTRVRFSTVYGGVRSGIQPQILLCLASSMQVRSTDTWNIILSNIKFSDKVSQGIETINELQFLCIVLSILPCCFRRFDAVCMYYYVVSCFISIFTSFFSDGLMLFRNFLCSEYSEENIEFWIACEEYKQLKSRQFSPRAQKIYSDFVTVHAPKEVIVFSHLVHILKR